MSSPLREPYVENDGVRVALQPAAIRVHGEKQRSSAFSTLVVGLFVPAGRSIISSHHTRQATTTRAAGRQDNSFDIYGKSPARHTSTRPQIIIPSRLLDDVEFLSKLVSGQPALLENRLKAPVAKGLCYRFFF